MLNGDVAVANDVTAADNDAVNPFILTREYGCSCSYKINIENNGD